MSPLKPLTGAVGLGGLLIGSGWWSASSLVRLAPRVVGPAAAPDDLLVVLCAGVATLISIWLVACWAAAVLTHLPGAMGRAAGRAYRRITPAALRGVMVIAVGTAVAAGSGQAALASPRSAAGVAVTVSASAMAPDAVARDLPDPGWSATASPSQAMPSPRTTEVTIRPGDTLWHVARRQLPPDASPLAIDRAWRQWYSANADIIGDDPDVLNVGQRLRSPSGAAS
jgi:LysM domain